MRGFVQVNQGLGTDSIGRMVAGSRFQVHLGATMRRLLPKQHWRDRIVEKLTGPIHDAAGAIDLPDYACPVGIDR